MATGVFASALNALGVSSIDGAADLFTVYDATGPEHKKIVASDVLKRWLSTADVSWMSALTMSGVVQANDKFLIWDADANQIKTMTGTELLSKTFSGVSQLTLALTSSTWDGTVDSFPVFDHSASQWKRLPLGQITDKLRPYITTDYASNPTPVPTASSGQRLTNRGSSSSLEFDLPAALSGYRYAFNRIANYAVRLDPNGSETIGDGGAGKYLEITGRGQVDIECLINGVWEVTGGSAVYSFEP